MFFSWRGSGLATKLYTILERSGRDKHSSIFEFYLENEVVRIRPQITHRDETIVEKLTTVKNITKSKLYCKKVFMILTPFANVYYTFTFVTDAFVNKVECPRQEFTD